jgi:hypothetical protein
LSVTTILRSRWTGTLVAGVIALSVAFLAALLLPGRVDAQEQATPNTTTKLVEPGDSLWTIAQAQFATDAAPQQVAEEVGRIYVINRDRIGDDPNFLLVGQELLVSPTLGELPRATEQPATEPTTSGEAEPVAEPVAQSVSAPVTESMIEPATAEEPAAEEGPSTSGPEGVVLGGIAVDQKIVGVGILSLTALIAILMVVWRLLIYRRPSSGWSLDHSQGYHPYGENYANYAAQSRYQEERQKEEQVTETGTFGTEEADPNLEIPAASASIPQANSRTHRLGDGFDRKTDRQTPKVLDPYWDPAKGPGKSR